MIKVYYAHSVHLYDTPQEERDVLLLLSLGFDVENPNQARHQSGYKANGMDYFVNGILPEMDACAFRALPDGSLGAGVAMEVEYFLDLDLPVIQIPNNWHFIKKLNVEETRAMLMELGRR